MHGETDWNIRIGKQGYVFSLSDFKTWCWCFAFLTSISVSRISCEWEKLNLLNESISWTFCLLGLLSTGSRLTKTSFVFGLVSLDSGLLEEFFLWQFVRKKTLYLFFFPARLYFSYLFNYSTILFLFLSFAQSCKILPKFSKLSAILKRWRKTM